MILNDSNFPVADDDDDQTMTGMMGATALNAVDDDDADPDEELDDGENTGGASFGGAT